MSLGHAEFLAQIQAADEEERPRLLLAFSLAQQPERIATAIEAAAVPHWFDREFLDALLDAEALSEQEFDHLTTLSFVEPHPTRGWNIHERTRDLLLERLWLETPERYRELSRRAVAHCETRDQQSADWRVETIYHQLVGDPERGWTELANQGWNWQNSPHFAYDKLEILARAAREHLNAERISGDGAAWTIFWEARLDQLYSRFREAKEMLLGIPPNSGLAPYTRSNCLESLGYAHLALCEVDAAQERYSEALTLYQTLDDLLGEANCQKGLANAHLHFSEVEAARKRYEEALTLYQTLGDQSGEAGCARGLGDMHLALSEVEGARGRYEEALALYQTIGDRLGVATCLRDLGDVHTRLSEFKTARERYEEALPLFQSTGFRLGEANCLQGLGEIYLHFHEVKLGGEKIKLALDIYLDIGEQIGQANCRRLLGDCELARAHHESAHDQYTQALAHFEQIGGREGVAECFEAFAKLYQIEGNEDKAAEAWIISAKLYDELDMPLRAAKCRRHERSY